MSIVPHVTIPTQRSETDVWLARLQAAGEIAERIAETDFVPQSLRGNPAAIVAAILYGHEVGLQPMQSLSKIAVIKGRPTLSAEAQRSLILGAGHEFWLEEATVTRAIACGRRRDSERVVRVMWTMDDAKRAGIAGGENWRRYPREMLVARVTAMLARQLFADVIGGLLATEEVEDEPENGSGFARTPAAVATPLPSPTESDPPATQRRSRPDTSTSSSGPQELLSDEQRRMIFALMRDVGLPPDNREQRLAFASRVVGRTLESSNELTKLEATKLIDELQALLDLPELERMQRLLAPKEAEIVGDLAAMGAEPVDESAKEAKTKHDDIPF